jgi:hypothetical protein
MFILEPSSGIEPPTSSLPRMRSTTELQGRISKDYEKSYSISHADSVENESPLTVNDEDPMPMN